MNRVEDIESKISSVCLIIVGVGLLLAEHDATFLLFGLLIGVPTLFCRKKKLLKGAKL
jgi:hypothetical protein